MPLSHFSKSGRIKMVDVSEKSDTARSASAECKIILLDKTVRLLKSKKLAKGDALTTAKVAGILAAKRVPGLIPLTHPLNITHCEISFSFEKIKRHTAVKISSVVRTKGPTGPDIEAMTSASIAALTVYDMVKAVDRSAKITSLKLIEKSGGKSGNWRRNNL